MSITWNGVSSDTIGVVVEKIPNRYVPTRRFSPQQVAGRNGNILLVDKSFPNVEQEYEVYLSAEAQGIPSVARACAEWLMGPDGYCRLQDSYDTTVYREAFLMGGYDLENILNKFGRCTITFSCKPQKYLLTGDTPISIPAGSTTTYTGGVVQFDGITGASITSLSTTIEPTQDLHGYANPWPAGGGKNLANFVNGYNITANGEIGTNAKRAANLDPIPIESGVSYIYTSETELSCIYAVFNGDTLVRRLSGIASGTTLDTSGGTDLYVCIYGSSDYTATVETDKPMVRKSTEPSGYAPYSNICPISGLTGLSVYVSPTQDPDDATVYNVDWSTQAGTVYGGTVDVVTGVLTVDRASVDLGSISWTYQSGYTYPYFQGTMPTDCVSGSDAPGQVSLVCSAYASIQNTTAASFRTANHNSQCCLNSAVATKRLLVQNSAYTDAVTFKTAMDGVQLVYDLETPLSYQLTPQEIGVLTGTNHVWLSDGDVSLTVTTPLGGIVTNPTPFEARPMLEVSGVGEITINGKSIQILESVSDFDIDCEAMEAEDNSKIYCMDFPELSGGENEIVGDGSITALTVTPRWWTL